MKITAWDIDRFGLWEKLSASDLSEQLNVFYGPNEAGKTTLMQFVRAMMYGFDGERRRYVKGPFPVFGTANETGNRQIVGRRTGSESIDHIHDANASANALSSDSPIIAGGRMSVTGESGPFLLKRQYNPAGKRGEEDNFTINTPDGLFAGDQILKQLTGEIDETTFNNVFAIGLDELQQLGILEDTEAAALLYRLTIGLDRVSLLDAARSLVRSRNRLIDPSGKPALIGRLVTQHATLYAEISRAKTRLREYGELLAEHRQHERVANQIEDEHKKLQREARLYETAIKIADTWDARVEIRREIKRMGSVIPVGADAVKSLDDLRADIVKQRDTLSRLKKEFGSLKNRYDLLEVNEELWKFTPRLEVVLEQEDWLRELGEQVESVKEEVRHFEQQLFETEKNVGGVQINVDPDDDTETDGEHKTRRLRDYRQPAKAVRSAQVRYQKTKEQYRQYAEKNRILSEKITGELSSRKIDDIAEAIEKTGEMVGHLRRRQTLQQRYEEMVQYRKELDRQNAFLVQHQALPNWVLGCGLAGIAIFGVMLFAPLLGLTDQYGISVVGLIGVAGLMGGKIFVEKKNAQKLKTNQRQITMLASQMEHAKQEVAAIDARYPAHGKSTEARLQTAQTELASLEKLVPLDGQMKEIAYQTEQLEDHLKKAKHGLKFARKRWHDWLKAVGLPLDTQPSQIRELMGHFDEVGGIQRHYNLKVEELAMRQREMEMLTDQITRVAAAAGITLPDGLTPVALMERIRKLIEENEQRIKERDQLRKDLRKSQKVRRKEKATLEDFKSKKRELLAQYKVHHDEELRELAKVYAEYQARLEKRLHLEREISAAIGGFCEESELAELFDSLKRENLPELLEQVRERDELLSVELHEQLEKRGRLTQQLADIGGDQTIAGKQLELAMLEHRISQHFSQWRVQGLATSVLKEIRTEYEQQRQPETLNEASRYFAAMTDGRYTRVWTPIGENTLYVDDFAGNSMDVTWLSRGTREQLFVAIRLALATTFERHGISLPLVMDDVLVNYDTRRAYATAKTLLEFSQGGAAGRQIFLFTCHEHICRMFHSLNVPVRILPSFADEHKVIRISLPHGKVEPVEEPPVNAVEEMVEENVEEPEIVEEDIVEENIVEENIVELEPEAMEIVVEPPKRKRRKKPKRSRKEPTSKPVVVAVEEIADEEIEEPVDDSEIDETEELLEETPVEEPVEEAVEAATEELIEEIVEEEPEPEFETFVVEENADEEFDEWAETFFEEEAIFDAYRQYHSGRVFDADFFDTVEDQEELESDEQM